MKDALGHGRNTVLGVNELPNMRRFIIPSRPVAGSGEYPARNSASDEAAAQALMSAKSSAVPIHPAMVGGRLNGTQADYTTAEYAALTKGQQFGKRTSAPAGKHPVEIYGRRNPL